MTNLTIRRWTRATLAAVVLLTSSCLVWRNQWRRTTAVRVADDVAYIDDGTDKHRLDVFAPTGAHNAPIVIFVHGGSWREGDRSFYEPIVGLYGNVGTALGERGVVTVVPSYRLWPAVHIAEQLDDIAAVVRWTQQHAASFGGDPRRIILAGHSAGGHLATTLAVQPGVAAVHGLSPDAIKGLVAISGIYDVVTTVASATTASRQVVPRPTTTTTIEPTSPPSAPLSSPAASPKSDVGAVDVSSRLGRAAEAGLRRRCPEVFALSGPDAAHRLHRGARRREEDTRHPWVVSHRGSTRPRCSG
jgi:acetyl esterase/lipase